MQHSRIFFAGAMLAGLVQPVFAGSVTIGAQSASPVVSASRSFTVSDADMVRLYAYVQASYPFNADGTAASRAQSLTMWSADMMRRIQTDVSDYERLQASRNIAPITAQ